MCWSEFFITIDIDDSHIHLDKKLYRDYKSHFSSFIPIARSELNLPSLISSLMSSVYEAYLQRFSRFIFFNPKGLLLFFLKSNGYWIPFSDLWCFSVIRLPFSILFNPEAFILDLLPMLLRSLKSFYDQIEYFVCWRSYHY